MRSPALPQVCRAYGQRAKHSGGWQRTEGLLAAPRNERVRSRDSEPAVRMHGARQPLPEGLSYLVPDALGGGEKQTGVLYRK